MVKCGCVHAYQGERSRKINDNRTWSHQIKKKLKRLGAHTFELRRRRSQREHLKNEVVVRLGCFECEKWESEDFGRYKKSEARLQADVYIVGESGEQPCQVARCGWSGMQKP